MNPGSGPSAGQGEGQASARSPAGGRRARTWLIACLVAALVGACASRPQQPTAEQRAAAQRQREQQEAARAEQAAAAKRVEEQKRREQEQAEATQLPPEFGTPAPLGDVTPAPRAPQAPAVAAAPGAAQPAGGAQAAQAAAPSAGAAPPAGAVARAPAAGVATVAPVYVPEKLPPANVPGAVPYDQAFPAAQDRVVRVGIVSGASQAKVGQGFARMLGQEDRKYMEDTLGLGVRIAYVSEMDEPPPPHTQVGYRPGFLKAAVHIAAMLPQPQEIVAMSAAQAERHNVDVLVRIGTDLR